MLIKEIRDYNKDVPEKKIILDQMDPSDVARLILQIAGYAAIDSLRGHPEKELSEEDVDSFVSSVIEDVNRLTTSSNMKKVIEDAKKGKL